MAPFALETLFRFLVWISQIKIFKILIFQKYNPTLKCRNFFAIVSILKILVVPDSSEPLLCYNRTFFREVSQVTRAWLIGRSGGSQNRSRAIGDLDQISSGFDRFWVSCHRISLQINFSRDIVYDPEFFYFVFTYKLEAL